MLQPRVFTDKIPRFTAPALPTGDIPLPGPAEHSRFD